MKSLLHVLERLPSRHSVVPLGDMAVMEKTAVVFFGTIGLPALNPVPFLLDFRAINKLSITDTELGHR